MCSIQDYNDKLVNNLNKVDLNEYFKYIVKNIFKHFRFNIYELFSRIV